DRDRGPHLAEPMVRRACRPSLHRPYVVLSNVSWSWTSVPPHVPALRSLSALAVGVSLATVVAPTGGSGAVARPVFATNAASDPALSSNWAGYAVTAPEGSPDASFTDVTGTWTQTKACCT